MISWLWLIPAVQVGVMLGIAIVSLLQMSRTSDEDEDAGETHEQAAATGRI